MNRARPLATLISSSLKSRPIFNIATRPTTFFNNTITTTTNNTLPRLFTTTSAKMSSINASVVLENIKNRRTYYPLSKDLTITPAKIQEIVKEALQHIPSSFNSQSNRVVVLFGAEHEKLWDIATEVLKAIVPADSWEATGSKMAMFKASGGTDVVNGMQEKFSIYADRFPVWAAHSDAMLQFAVWTSLEAEGLGANLQHYNPLIDAKVVSEWNIPQSWKLSAQLVFGGKTGEAGEKAFAPVESKFKN
ncbi:Putative nitroreductase HBN1 [Cytospora mali]|uniref:Nitroreductase HBN1 n=1 Tax=Cytospora mali TaxID=578113 RepID=A0A194W4T1_CYTMA|nr:Putative nitroreductase HBN1 [Valsa mali]